MTVLDWLAAALYLYLFMVSAKQAVKGGGPARAACLVIGLLVLPSAAFMHFYGGWDLSRSGKLMSPAAWWVVTVPNPGGGDPRATVRATATSAAGAASRARASIGVIHLLLIDHEILGGHSGPLSIC